MVNNLNSDMKKQIPLLIVLGSILLALMITYVIKPKSKYPYHIIDRETVTIVERKPLN